MESTNQEGINDIGLIISSLQDELKDVRIQLENIPGYPKGEIPQYLVKLQRSLIQVRC